MFKKLLVKKIKKDILLELSNENNKPLLANSKQVSKNQLLKSSSFNFSLLNDQAPTIIKISKEVREKLIKGTKKQEIKGTKKQEIKGTKKQEIKEQKNQEIKEQKKSKNIRKIKKTNKNNNLNNQFSPSKKAKQKKILENYISNIVKFKFKIRYRLNKGLKRFRFSGKILKIINNLMRKRRAFNILKFKSKLIKFNLQNKVNKIENFNKKLGSPEFKINFISLTKAPRKNSFSHIGLALPSNTARTGSEGAPLNPKIHTEVTEYASNNFNNASSNTFTNLNSNKKITIAHYPYANQLINKEGFLKIKGQTLKIQDPRDSEKKIRGSLPLNLIKNDFKLKNSPLRLPNKKGLNLRVSKYMRYMQTINWNIANYKNICYKFFTDTKKSIKNVQILLKNFFHRMFSYISKPVIIISPNKVIIKLFYFKLKNNKIRNKFNTNYFKILFALAEILSGFFKKPVELVLIRIYRVYNESQIFADSMGLLSYKKKMRFRKITKKVFKRLRIINNPELLKRKVDKKKAFAIPLSAKVSNNDGSLIYSCLTGLNIKLGGRLNSQRVIPRKTVQTKITGSLSKTKSDFVSTGRFTGKSKRGAYSISVNLGYICI